ncbi:MAG: LptF/LptG family permease [Helicobacter sp.]|nr:LptF/LptG family permease [Helicobacter sp.]
MKITHRYILLHLAQIFFSIFFILFFISSVILLIRIATVTFIIKMNFVEFFLLYFYSLPIMLFFVLPVTFFVASVATLANLSKEYELPVLFSLGFAPRSLFTIFAPLCFLLSMILLLFSFVLIPTSNELYRSFLNQKKQNLNLNLEATDFAQKLGSWLVYIGEKDGESYKDVVLFSNKSLQQETFIIADQIELQSNHNALEILIFKGNVFLNNLSHIGKIDYEKIINRIAFSAESGHLNFIEYWKKIGNAMLEVIDNESHMRKNEGKKVLRNFSTYLLVSLFPLISLALIPLLGIMHPRFAHSYTYIFVIGIIGIFYGCVHVVATYSPIAGILPMLLLWTCGSYALYRRKIAKFF